MLGRLANTVLGCIGLELRPKTAAISVRTSHLAILHNARRNGLEVSTVIDVGAALGDFSRDAAQVFPGKDFLLIEPLDAYGLSLERTINELDGRATWVKAIASTAPGGTILNVHDDLVGSSTLKETEHGVDGTPRPVAAIKIDDEVSSRNLPPPYLLKIDVQGSELVALGGAGKVLDETAFVLLEVSFLDFFQGGASITDVIAYMAAHDFVPYDLTSPLYRPLDGALAQIDVCFAKKSGVLRRNHGFATPEQRRDQNQTMRTALARRIGTAAGDGQDS